MRSSIYLSFCALLATLISVALLMPAKCFSKDVKTKHLFKIERSKNANIVQYDVQLTSDGKCDPKEPIIAYWVMLAEDGKKANLNWIEKKMAYGFNAKYHADGDYVILDLVADIQRDIKAHPVNGVFRAETVIDGRQAFIGKIYIKSIETKTLPKVEYIELFGKDIKTGEDRHEKFIPKD